VYPRGTLPFVPFKIKDAGLRLRVEREIRQEFVEVCRAEGKTAAQVLREYMRDYIARNRAAAQRELFTAIEGEPGWAAGQGSRVLRDQTPGNQSRK
jgi:hypothetical protein